MTLFSACRTGSRLKPRHQADEASSGEASITAMAGRVREQRSAVATSSLQTVIRDPNCYRADSNQLTKAMAISQIRHLTIRQFSNLAITTQLNANLGSIAAKAVGVRAPDS